MFQNNYHFELLGDIVKRQAGHDDLDLENNEDLFDPGYVLKLLSVKISVLEQVFSFFFWSSDVTNYTKFPCLVGMENIPHLILNYCFFGEHF